MLAVYVAKGVGQVGETVKSVPFNKVVELIEVHIEKLKGIVLFIIDLPEVGLTFKTVHTAQHKIIFVCAQSVVCGVKIMGCLTELDSRHNDEVVCKGALCLFRFKKALAYGLVKTVCFGTVAAAFAVVGYGDGAKSRTDGVLAHKHDRVKSVVGIVGMNVKIHNIFIVHYISPRINILLHVIIPQQIKK